MRKKLIVFASILVVAAVLFAAGSAAASLGQKPVAQATPPAGQESGRTVIVNGSGKAYLTPDIAYVTIGVHTEGKDAAEAVASNNTQTKAVTDALKGAGIDSKDIQTTNFSIWPSQQYDPQGKALGVTYMVDNSVYVTVRDLSKIGTLLNVVVEAGANSINGIQFDVADKTAALADARKAAIANAREIAGELAQAAGVSLGDVVSISTNTAYNPIPMYDGRGGAAMESASNVPINPGQTIINVDVVMTFAIR